MAWNQLEQKKCWYRTLWFKKSHFSLWEKKCTELDCEIHFYGRPSASKSFSVYPLSICKSFFLLLGIKIQTCGFFSSLKHEILILGSITFVDGFILNWWLKCHFHFGPLSRYKMYGKREIPLLLFHQLNGRPTYDMHTQHILMHVSFKLCPILSHSYSQNLRFSAACVEPMQLFTWFKLDSNSRLSCCCFLVNLAIIHIHIGHFVYIEL